MLGIATGDSWTAEALMISSRFLASKVSTVAPSRRIHPSAAAVREEGQVDPDAGDLLYTDVDALRELTTGIEGKWGAPSRVPQAGMWAPTGSAAMIPQRWRARAHTHTHTWSPAGLGVCGLFG